MELGPGGSTAVTAIVIDGKGIWVANIGDSRAVVCEGGFANQLTVDHEPDTERKRIEKQGGFVITFPGNISPFFFSTSDAFQVSVFWWNILQTTLATIMQIVNWVTISIVQTYHTILVSLKNCFSAVILLTEQTNDYFRRCTQG